LKIATYDYKHGWHLVNEGYAVFHLYGHEGPLPPPSDELARRPTALISETILITTSTTALTR
jgi:hypothetical protein